ncbi:hypothetical protein M3Y94_01266600 [Aphelenchoides besseyi]|nr:hypothetical protein M3Y94_01266600 [Aphelenchoides besseyi]KAI6222593.1 hypothetical protein M3Y95_00910100 [Aphelenchoides besseyi]
MSEVNLSPATPLSDVHNRFPDFYLDRPVMLPFKSALRSSANSSMSSLRSAFTPRTPVRFADPLTEVLGNPSSYFQYENEKAATPRIHSDLKVGGRNSVKQVDYRVPHRSRPLEVRVANRSLWIDPKQAADISPQISAFLLRESTMGHKSSVEPKLDDLNYDDVLEAVRACCPTDLGLFATPVTIKTFPVLARMSRTFNVQKLKAACELFVARLSLKSDELSAIFTAGLLNDAYKYGMNKRTKVRLLQGVIGLMESERIVNNPVKVIAHTPKHVEIAPIISSLLDVAMIEYKLGNLNHGDFLNEARLKIPCRVCRIEATGNSPEENNLVVCSTCRQTCCRKCLVTPCPTLLEQLMDKFAKEYTTPN